MRNKIKEALQQGHKNLGLNDEVFERVASSVETFIKDESEISGFVNSENTLNLLKSYQSVNDRLRTLEAQSKQKPNKEAEPAVEQSESDNKPTPKQDNADLAKMIADAVAAAVKPISDDLSGFKAEQQTKSAVKDAKAKFKGNEYVKRYSEEATDAWERASELYEATGKSWTAEQLNEKAMSYFTKMVGRKGVDTTKPFEGSGGGEAEVDFADQVKKLQEAGLLPKESSNK